MARSLTRDESKLITRRRLLEAAARVLCEEGLSALTTGRVSRDAGVAQPTFYVHFRDMEELLRTLAQEKIGQVRQPLRQARQRLRTSANDDPLRETFRLPLQALVEQPELFRLYIQEYHRPGSPVGKMARETQAELQLDLMEDLTALGAPASTPAERARLEMVAEGLIVLTQTLALGYLEGRYEDLEAIVDVLVEFTRGPSQLLPQGG
jgi:AcrR family transcriptional regulator